VQPRNARHYLCPCIFLSCIKQGANGENELRCFEPLENITGILNKQQAVRRQKYFYESMLHGRKKLLPFLGNATLWAARQEGWNMPIKKTLRAGGFFLSVGIF